MAEDRKDDGQTGGRLHDEPEKGDTRRVGSGNRPLKDTRAQTAGAEDDPQKLTPAEMREKENKATRPPAEG